MDTLLNNPQYLGLTIAASIVILIIFAAPSLPLISAISQAIAKSQKKSFYDKFGKQLTRMCLIFSCTAVVVVILGAARYLTLDPSLIQGPYQLPLIITAALFVLAPAVLFAYFGSWKALRKQKGTHMLIGYASSVLFFLAAAFAIVVLKSVQSPLHVLPSTGTPVEVLQALLEAGNSNLFIMHVAIAFVAGFALCGTYAQVYLLSRREKDDFGRDYYKFAVPYAAKWALSGALLQIAATAALLWSSYLFIIEDAVASSLTFQALIQHPIIISWALPFVLPMLCCILWAVIINSATPLRRKVSIYCAAVLMLVADLSLLLVISVSMMAPLT